MDKTVNKVTTKYGMRLRHSIYRTSIHCHLCSSTNTYASTPGPLLLMLILCNDTPAIRNASLLSHTQRVLYYVNMQIQFVTSPHTDDSACGLWTSSNKRPTIQRISLHTHNQDNCLKEFYTSRFWRVPYKNLFIGVSCLYVSVWCFLQPKIPCGIKCGMWEIHGKFVIHNNVRSPYLLTK